MQPSNMTNEELLIASGGRWPAWEKALKHFSNPKKCQHKYAAARNTLEQFITKNGSMTR